MGKEYNVIKIPEYITKILFQISKLSMELLKSKNNLDLYVKSLDDNFEYIEWINKSIKLRSNDIPNDIRQREVFFCQLGINIGSEQSYKRPVVILQNDIGNSKSDTVIIAPITTYEHSAIIKKDDKIFVKVFKDGKIIEKNMDFYNVLVELEDGFKNEIIGFINIIHMREVSKKRLSKTPIAKITKDNYIQVQNAIIKNLNFNIDKSV